MEFEPTKPPYKQPKRPAEPSEEDHKEAPRLREFSQEELKEILEQHQKWLETEQKEGKGANFFKAKLQMTGLHAANLQGANLGKANLQGAILPGAILREANLQNADLRAANLEKANLRAANLEKANLVWGANLSRANLCAANLQEAKLVEANLQEAILVGANLQGASLRAADLRGANLGGANLQKASFNSAVLRGTHFQDADLRGCKGLLANQLAGANVSGAKLPDNIAKFEGLGQVKETSQRAQKLFLSLLLGCVYCWLTIATTTDVALIINSGSSPLPIIQTKIPIAYFYWAAPFILLSLYLWFHLYLQRLWERLSKLPAVFTDGESLDEKGYPWLISGMVCSHVRLLKERRPALSRIQAGISIVLAWWLVPFTFFFFWLRYIPRHDWVGTSLHVGVLAVSITAAILLYRLATKTLRGEKTSSLSWKENAKSLPAYQHVSLMLGILGLGLITFSTLSTWAIEGVAPWSSVSSWEDLSKSTSKMSPYKWHAGPVLLPRLFDYFGYRTYVNLQEADISTKPSTWAGQEDKRPNEISLVKGAKLEGANLQYANMRSAFLINADLRGANLQNARLQTANLQKTKLGNTNLQGADLSHTNLQGANLGRANLQKAFLFGANLQEANLQMANLKGANLHATNLQGANLTLAKNLTQPQLNQACVDKFTSLPEGLTLPQPCKEKKIPPWLP